MTHPTVQSHFCCIVSLIGCFIITIFLYSTYVYDLFPIHYILLFRCMIFCMGIIVNKKGKQVTVEEAPILVVAPHSTILDWVR